MLQIKSEKKERKRNKKKHQVLTLFTVALKSKPKNVYITLIKNQKLTRFCML